MLRDLIFDLISLVFTLLPMVLSGALIAGLLSIGGWATRWRWFHWILASPVLYMLWLIVLLAIWAVSMGRAGRKHPKPRYVVFRSPEDGRIGGDPDVIVAGIGYRRLGIIASLPLVRLLETSRVLKGLVYRAYSTRFQF